VTGEKVAGSVVAGPGDASASGGGRRSEDPMSDRIEGLYPRCSRARRFVTNWQIGGSHHTNDGNEMGEDDEEAVQWFDEGIRRYDGVGRASWGLMVTVHIAQATPLVATNSRSTCGLSRSSSRCSSARGMSTIPL
jgi:hypothetical protein